MNKDSIIKTINNEKLDTNELAELFWLLNKDQYKEIKQLVPDNPGE